MNLGVAFDAVLGALAADLPPAFVAATMPGGGQLAARLHGFTAKLNITRVLATGEVPLHVAERPNPRVGGTRVDGRARPTVDP